jgi:hypothetical protein
VSDSRDEPRRISSRKAFSFAKGNTGLTGVELHDEMALTEEGGLTRWPNG